MKERAVVLRKDPALLGVLTEATAGPATSTVPGVLLLNAGVVHRVGPNRLHVRLARALAAAGFPVLRFDLSRLGDSDVRIDSLSITESAPAETREAMDFMTGASGVKTFVLAGICSGASTAFQVALADPRVVGVFLIEPHAFPTLKGHILYYLRRLGQFGSWHGAIFRQLAFLSPVLTRLGRTPGADHEEEAALATLDSQAATPSRDEVAPLVRQLIERGVQMCMVYSGVPRGYTYQRQFQDAFPDVPFKDQLTVVHVKDADHTFSRLHTQERLVQEMTRWILGAFVDRAPSTSCAPSTAAGTLSRLSLRVPHVLTALLPELLSTLG
jgi:pimeloyl-ACP methyl ester carboxylesterase